MCCTQKECFCDAGVAENAILSSVSEARIGKPRGYHDDLKMYCAMAFDRNDATACSNLCPSTHHKSNLFVWTKEILEWLNKWKKGGSMVDKQLSMTAYLWEIVYNLMLPWDYNVSESPGYESFGLRDRSK